jgi:hypothetical protein
LGRRSAAPHAPTLFYEYCQIAAGTEKLVSEPLPGCRELLEADPAVLRSIAKLAGRFRRQFMRFLYTGGFLNLWARATTSKYSA